MDNLLDSICWLVFLSDFETQVEDEKACTLAQNSFNILLVVGLVPYSLKKGNTF